MPPNSNEYPAKRVLKRPRVLGRRNPTEQRDHERANDKTRASRLPWRAWYGLVVWKRIRAAKLASDPLCARCLVDGIVTPATVVNHVDPHRGDWSKFIGGPFESVCKPHHDADIQREEAAARKQSDQRGWSKV